MQRLFSQSRKNRPKKTIYFIVPNRNKNTLHNIIINNVLPNSTVFTDEWKGYCGLKAKGFDHKTSCKTKVLQCGI